MNRDEAIEYLIKRNIRVRIVLERIQMWDTTKTYEEMAKKIGTSSCVVVSFKQRYGLPALEDGRQAGHRPRSPLRLAQWNLSNLGWSQSDIARIFGVSRQMVNEGIALYQQELKLNRRPRRDDHGTTKTTT